jgi:hypothetical protein
MKGVKNLKSCNQTENRSETSEIESKTGIKRNPIWKKNCRTQAIVSFSEKDNKITEFSLTPLTLVQSP